MVRRMRSIYYFYLAATLLALVVCEVTSYRDCQELIERQTFQGKTCECSLPNDAYWIRPEIVAEAIKVYCEKDSDGVIWTWIQHRKDGSLDFGQNWTEYKNGFGDAAGEFWLGNEKIRLLTNQSEYRIKFEMTHISLGDADADYDSFRLEDESDNYRLRLGSFTGGTAGDAMSATHNNMPFTTMDNDNDNNVDKNCASSKGGNGGWWYDSCDLANFNGMYYAGGSTGGLKDGLEWNTFSGSQDQSMIKVTMKITRA